VSPVIGYQNAAYIAEKAAAEERQSPRAIIQADEYDRIIILGTMIGRGLAGA
jgi:fumarate hydratase class II